MWARVAAEMGREPLRTYETVLKETPAFSATSFIVAMDFLVETFR
jgi:hypothetical protein